MRDMKQETNNYLPKCSEDAPRRELIDRRLVNACLAIVTIADSHRIRGLLNRYELCGSVVETCNSPIDHPWAALVVDMRRELRAYEASRRIGGI